MPPRRDSDAAALIGNLSRAWPPGADSSGAMRALAGSPVLSRARVSAQAARVEGVEGQMRSVCDQRPAPATPMRLPGGRGGRRGGGARVDLIAQGLPAPHNLRDGPRSEAVFARKDDAATVAVDRGRVIVGADGDLLEPVSRTRQTVRSAPSVARSRAARQPASSRVDDGEHDDARAASRRHRGARHPVESASVACAAGSGRPRRVVRSVGSKLAGNARGGDLLRTEDRILDVGATVELLETRRVPLIGYRVDELPAFFSIGSGLSLGHRVEDPGQAAALFAAHRSIDGNGGLLFLQPPPPELAIALDEVEAWTDAAIRDAEARQIRGGAVTPHVLAYLAEHPEGRTLRANIGLIVNNARTAARIAVALAHR